MRVAASTPAVLRIVVEDEVGDVVDSSTPVQVTVVDGDGAQVASGTAAHESEGVYVFRFLAPTKLDMLTATAVATVSGFPQEIVEHVRVVQELAFRLSDLRAEGVAPELVRGLEERASELVEQVLGFSPVLVGRRLEFTLDNYRDRITLPIPYLHGVYSLTGPDGAVLARTSGHGIVREDGMPFTPGIYQAHIRCGLPVITSDLSAAVKALAQHLSTTSSYDARTVRVMTEGAELYLARVGDDRPTGLPEVDQVLTKCRITNSIGVSGRAYA